METNLRPSVLSLASGAVLPDSRLYQGASVFLIASGPGLLDLDLEGLRRPGILTMGINNSPKTFRPHLWVAIDPPGKFLRSVWLDPTIQKFVPRGNLDHSLFDSQWWMEAPEIPRRCPNVFSFETSCEFSPETFLDETCVCLGNSPERGGGRSVLLAALKVLYSLGVKRVFLLGVDFRMASEKPYHFDESVSKLHVEANNRAYLKLDRFLSQLAPRFSTAGMEIWNCQPGSALTAFPHLPLEHALNLALEGFPVEVASERTRGLYGRMAEANDSIDNAPHDAEKAMGDSTVQRPPRDRVLTVLSAEDLPKTTAPETCGVVIFSDRESEWLLPWFLGHFRRHHPDLPAVLFDFGISPEARKTAESRIEVLSFEPRHPFPTAWYHKPFVLADSPFSHTLFLDLDCEVRAPVDELLGWSAHGLVLGRDRHPMRAYRKLFRRDHFFNSGVVATARSNPVVGLWCEATLRLYRELRGDQEILNLVLLEHELPVVALPEHYHQLRLDGDHPDARIMHWTGPAGKDMIRHQMRTDG